MFLFGRFTSPLCAVVAALFGVVSTGPLCFGQIYNQARTAKTESVTVEVGALIRGLKGKDPGAQVLAAQRLARIGEPAVEPLIAALDDNDPIVRMFAAEALRGILRQIKDPRAVGPLITVLKTPDPNGPPDEAEGALVETGAPAVPPLIAALNSTPALPFSWSNPQPTLTRWYLIRALAEIRDSGAIEPLIAALDDPEPRNRAAAFDGVIETGTQATAPLLAALKKRRGSLQQLVAAALLELRDPREVKDLRKAELQGNTFQEWVWKGGRPRKLKQSRTQKGALIAGAVSLLIEHGNPDSEDALVWALNEFGDRDMAVDFLNCGNATLEQAATAWAQVHGYQVESGGGGRVRWGSGW